MKAIHIICHPSGDGFQNLWEHTGRSGFFKSACWLFPNREELEPLVGGWIYLHQTKSTPSYIGGVIEKIERCEREDHPSRLAFAFNFERRPEGSGARWRGKDHDRAWTGEPVEATLAHEA